MRAGKARERVMKIGGKHSVERETSRWKVVFVGFSQLPFCLCVANWETTEKLWAKYIYFLQKTLMTIFNMLPSKLKKLAYKHVPIPHLNNHLLNFF